MARAAVSDYVNYMGSVYPAGMNSTIASAFIKLADAEIDAHTAPRTIPTSGNEPMIINLQITERLRLRAFSARKSSGLQSSEGRIYPDWQIVTPQLDKLMKAQLKDTTNYGLAVGNMIAE